MALGSAFLTYRVKGIAFVVHFQFMSLFYFFTHCGVSGKGLMLAYRRLS